MSDSSPCRKKRKLTITATPNGVETAEKALLRLGFDSKSNFAESQLLSRTVVTKFFNLQPIQRDSFEKICNELKLNWQEIAGMKQQIDPKPIEKQVNPKHNLLGEGMQLVKTLGREITVVDQQSQAVKTVITLQGDISSPPNLRILAAILQEYGGDTVKIVDIQEGSIKLFVEGSQEDIERLISQIQAGELREVDGFPISDIQLLLNQAAKKDESSKKHKWHLVEEIVKNPIRERNLSGADLSDANLRGAYLASANLSDADLSDCDLCGADLSRANLRDANLSDADLSDADLSDADLSDANLSNANLSNANLSNVIFQATQFANNLGMRGAFETLLPPFIMPFDPPETRPLDPDNSLLQSGVGSQHGTFALEIIDSINKTAPKWVIGSGNWANSLMEFVDAAKASGQKNAIINLSLDLIQTNSDSSVTTRYKLTLQEREALEYARQNGVMIVVAAGNNNDVMSVWGQAFQNFDNIIAVGSGDINGRYVYSSYGQDLNLLAEGGTPESGVLLASGTGLGTLAVTFVAAAKVASVVSLVWAANPDLNYRQVIGILTERLNNYLSKKVLMLPATPKVNTLQLHEEVREIKTVLQRAKKRHQFELKQYWAVRVRDVTHALLEEKPQLVHFSGHGAGNEGLALENETGQTQFVNAEALAELFGLFAARGLECVILDACYSEVQAEAIVQHIPYVIGMKKAIGDQAAIEFAVGFYDALVAGKSIEFAYQVGCQGMQLSGITDPLIFPILMKKRTV